MVHADKWDFIVGIERVGDSVGLFACNVQEEVYATKTRDGLRWREGKRERERERERDRDRDREKGSPEI